MNTIQDFEARLNELEQDLVRLEAENSRLRTNTQSTYFERDACIGLIARMAVRLGLKAGCVQRQTELGLERRVVVDLPSGQVSWDYLEAEAHLFEWLPEYPAPVQEQSIQDIYMRVMNPGLV
jgi:hypothetical protein